jgi:hypothetical protein
MGASAGELIFRGKSGRTYCLDVYQPDAVATSLTFNPTGLAGTGSTTTWRAPEDMALVDWSVVTGATAVGVNIQVNNNSVVGGCLRHAIHLNTLNNRPALFLPIRAGDFISGLQY